MSEQTENIITISLIAFCNLLIAFFLSGLVIWFVGEDPWFAFKVMLKGAFGYDEGIGYTLYYTTNFIFTGLAFAIAFHCKLFNIGAEGQAYIGGLGVGLVCLWFEDMPFILILPLAIFVSALFGAVWGAIPGYLQAKRGSHVVITTIMFNFIASVIMVYLLVNVLIKPGQMSPESREFGENGWLPQIHEVMSWFGMKITPTPLNLSLIWGFICCFLVWRYIWHTRWGYELRAVGANETAAVYAGISVNKNIILSMAIAGALASFVGINEIMGFNHRLILNFQFGYGFTGIAVSLIGRNHPLGIILASLLFGILYQGGAELAFEIQTINHHMVVLIQGLVILFAGAFENQFRPQIKYLVHLLFKSENTLTDNGKIN